MYCHYQLKLFLISSCLSAIFNAPSTHAKDTNIIAGVAACKLTGCGFNSDFECSASSIVVGKSVGEINCVTYRS